MFLRNPILAAVAFAAIAAPGTLQAQASGSLPAPVTLTAQEDRANMMAQLGIRELRPGPTANEGLPNSANYDQATANPYPALPEILRLNNGNLITTSQEWWTQRRPEIVELFDRELYGRVPANVPAVNWVVVGVRDVEVAGVMMVERRLEGRVDNSAYPAIEVTMQASVAVPRNATRDVPILVRFGNPPNFGPPAAAPAGGRGFGPGPGGQASAGGPGGAPAAGAGGRQGGAPPAAGGPAGAGGPPPAAGAPPAAQGGRQGGAPPAAAQPSPNEQLVMAGWGYAYINPGSIQADNGAGLTRGIIGLVNRGQPRTPEQWGSLRAWGWGAARFLDYLETVPGVDARRIGIEGVSRYGKAALVTAAYDPRFAAVLIGSAGEGGISLFRRNFGEQTENLTATNEYHWMAGNFLKYGASDAVFGEMNIGDIPVDTHQLLALVAPRLAFISYGVPERGDAHWLDHQGSFMAGVAAGPIYRLLGARGLGTATDFYMLEQMPDVNVDMLSGELGWRQHDGGHTSTPNIIHFANWANRIWAEQTLRTGR